MARVKQDKKVLTPAERAELALLEAESDRVLEQLFDDPSNRALLDRLNRIDVAMARVSGEAALEINNDFYGR